MVKAVLFDLGGTLIETAPVSLIFGKILDVHGIYKPITEDKQVFKEVEAELALEDYKLSYEEFWRCYNIYCKIHRHT